MRVTGNTFSNSIADQLNLLTAREYQLQNQATTGMRIRAPEDDPAGMEQTLNLETQGSNNSQYAQNITTLQSRAANASSVLSQVQDLMVKTTEIATNPGNAGSQQIQVNASLVTGYIKQAVQLLNTKNGDQYLFGGTASGQPPFALTTDANGNVTGVAYQGNTSVTQSQIGDNSTISIDAPGENNTGSGPRGVVSDSRYGADMFGHMISLQNNLLSGNTAAITSTDAPNLSKDETNIIYQVADNGAVQSRLDAAASAAGNQQTGLQTSLNNVAGADLTQTLTQLTQTQNAFQIALQTSSNIMQLQTNLLQYLP